MTKIDFRETSPEFKKGYKRCMQDLFEWCQKDSFKDINELERALRAALRLDDLLHKNKSNE